MICYRRCLMFVMSCLVFGGVQALADQWPVFPTGEPNCTGSTDYFAATDGPITISGGATTGVVRKQNGYLKFDVTAIPDGVTVGALQWNYYVDNAFSPAWSVTPLDLDPADPGITPQQLWEDLEAERNAGYYLYLNEPTTYDPGWHSIVLGGTAAADLTSVLSSGQDWFAFGGVSRDPMESHFQWIHGHTDLHQPYLVVTGVQPPFDLLCNSTPAGVDLVWSNGALYDAIEVYVDDQLEVTLPGTASATTISPAPGYRCIHLCALSGLDSSCSEPCCLIHGYDEGQLLWDFEADDGGFVVEGTGAWEWGEATFGPCSGGAFGRHWGTALQTNYSNNACWLLDSSPITLGGTGHFISIDHCYDAEFGRDGGTLWFTTDDFWYNTSEPVKGGDAVINGYTPLCAWVEGYSGFTGSSGGWVTDHWDFTDPKWQNQSLKLRFAFAADSSVTAPGWLIDNITLFTNYQVPISCSYTITPTSGTVPFSTTHQVTLFNNYSGGAAMTRRVAARIALNLAGGSSFNPWRAGFTNIAPGSFYYTQFPVNFPALGSLIGSNTFAMTAMDVTPAPYNQAPYPPSGSTCTRTNQVTASAP